MSTTSVLQIFICCNLCFADVLVESVTSLPVYKTGTGTVAAEDVGLVLSSSTSSNVDPVRLEGILSPRDGEVHLSPRDGKVHLSPCDGTVHLMNFISFD